MNLCDSLYELNDLKTLILNFNFNKNLDGRSIEDLSKYLNKINF